MKYTDKIPIIKGFIHKKILIPFSYYNVDIRQ